MILYPANFLLEVLPMFYPEKQISVKGLFTVIDSQKKPGFNFEGESHPFWELVYIKDGNVGVSADERIYNLCTGDIIFHKPMEFHRIWTNDDNGPRLYVLTFEIEGDAVKKLENVSRSLDEAEKIMLERCMDKGKKAFNFCRSRQIESVADDRLCQEYCNALEDFLLLNASVDCSESLPAESTSGTKLFSDIVLYLRDNIGEKLSLEGIAERFFVSPSRIKKMFAKYSGLGVIAYFNNMKMLEAQKLLREGLNVAEAAERLGFSNQFYFSSVFKKTVGMTPTAFKIAEHKEKT